MCKVCEKSLYYEDTEFSLSDEAPLGVERKYAVDSFICPACGKLKKSAVDMFGSKDKALIYLMTLNMDDLSVDAAYLNQFKEILRISRQNHFEKVLEKNGLRFENGQLIHSCGHVLLSGVKEISDYSMIVKIGQILGDKHFNFCPNCGKQLLPFDKNVEMTPSSSLYEPL